eukprot:SAG31_NODE_526_length_14475_cov_5.135197_16_plen_105_part_00
MKQKDAKVNIDILFEINQRISTAGDNRDQFRKLAAWKKIFLGVIVFLTAPGKLFLHWSELEVELVVATKDTVRLVAPMCTVEAVLSAFVAASRAAASSSHRTSS